MDSRDLTREQAAQMRESILPALRYLHALRDRMVKRGFPPNDKLRQATERAYDAVYALSIELHYASCDPGQVGRNRR